MLGLADMFDGWAQSGRTDPANMARLLGWSDGFRGLVAEVGVDYVPPETPADAHHLSRTLKALRMPRALLALDDPGVSGLPSSCGDCGLGQNFLGL
jgi:hypothetical protein